MNTANVRDDLSTRSSTPWKSSRSGRDPLVFARDADAVRFSIGLTPDGHGKHLALIAHGHVLRRSLCGYSVVPHPDGEASMIEWDERCCPECAALRAR